MNIKLAHTTMYFYNAISTEVEKCSSYISPFRFILDGFCFYKGVQMAQPFQQDKKSGVMKFSWRNCIPKKSSSRKSVVDSVKATALQLGARDEFI